MAAVDLAPAALVLARAWLDLAAPASGSAGDQAAVDLLVGAGWITISSALKDLRAYDGLLVGGAA